MHPARPWVLSADEKGVVVHWDYKLQTIISAIHPQDLLQHFERVQERHARARQEGK